MLQRSSKTGTKLGGFEDLCLWLPHQKATMGSKNEIGFNGQKKKTKLKPSNGNQGTQKVKGKSF